MKGREYLVGPIVFAAFVTLLLVVWAVMEPAALRRAFDNDGKSVVELLTLPFFAAIVPLVWWKCPFSGSAVRRGLLCAAVSCVAVMAIVKELDLHLMAMQALFPEVVDSSGSVCNLVKPDGSPLTGTPFKMRFLTNAGAPLAAKGVALFYFGAFFGVFAGLLAYYFPALVKGIFTLHPVAWTVSCLGASGVMVQLCDRMPAWVRHARGLPKEKAVDAVSSFFTALEEGGELMIAVFALIAIYQAHRMYFGECDDVCDDDACE